MFKPMSDMRMEKRLPPEVISRKQALRLFVLAAAGLFASSIISMLLPPMEGDGRILVLNLFYYLLFIGLPCLFCLRKKPGALQGMRPNPISLPITVFIVVLAVLCVFFVNDLLLLWSIPFQRLGFNVNAGAMEIPTTRSALLLCILYAAVLPGIFEEGLFRGVLMPAFEQQGTRRAIRISSLLFALLHGSIIGLPAQLLLGMLIAEMVICCDSIYAGLIFHTAYNAATIILQYYQIAADPAMAAPVEDYFSAIGGWDGVLSLVISILLTGALLRFSLRSFRLRAKLAKVPLYPAQKDVRWEKSEKLLLALGLVLVLLLYAISTAGMLMM